VAEFVGEDVHKGMGGEVCKGMGDEVGVDIIVILPTSAPNTLTPTPTLKIKQAFWDIIVLGFSY